MKQNAVCSVLFKLQGESSSQLIRTGLQISWLVCCLQILLQKFVIINKPGNEKEVAGMYDSKSMDT